MATAAACVMIANAVNTWKNKISPPTVTPKRIVHSAPTRKKRRSPSTTIAIESWRVDLAIRFTRAGTAVPRTPLKL